MNRQYTFKFMIAACLLSVPLAAGADWYVGAGVGTTNADSIDIAFDAPPAATSDDQDNGYKVFVGFAPGSNFAIEGGYVDLGEYDAQEAGVFSAGLDTDAWYVSLVGRTNVYTNWYFFGRLGLAMWNADLAYSDFVSSSSGDDSGVDPVVGLGFEYRFSDNFFARVEWEQFQNIGQDVRATIPSGTLELNGNDIDLLSLSIVYRFDLAPGP